MMLPGASAFASSPAAMATCEMRQNRYLYQDRKIHFFKKIETGSRAFITYFFHFFTSHITVHFCGLTGIIPLMHLRTVLTPPAA